MESDQELNRRHAAPTELWIGLALLIIGTIIALRLLNNDGRKDQINVEKKTTYLKTEFYGKEKIQSFTGTRSFKI